MDKSALCWLAWRAVGEAFPDAPARLDNDDERGFTSRKQSVAHRIRLAGKAIQIYWPFREIPSDSSFSDDY